MLRTACITVAASIAITGCNADDQSNSESHLESITADELKQNAQIAATDDGVFSHIVVRADSHVQINTQGEPVTINESNGHPERLTVKGTLKIYSND